LKFKSLKKKKEVCDKIEKGRKKEGKKKEEKCRRKAKRTMSEEAGTILGRGWGC